jgi:hypothetical protein
MTTIPQPNILDANNRSDKAVVADMCRLCDNSVPKSIQRGALDNQNRGQSSEMMKSVGNMLQHWLVCYLWKNENAKKV